MQEEEEKETREDVAEQHRGNLNTGVPGPAGLSSGFRTLQMEFARRSP